MYLLRILSLLSMTILIEAAPLASVHVKFTSEPHSYEHGLTTDGGNTVAQKSYLSVGRRSPQRISREFGSRITTRQSVNFPAERSLNGHVILPTNAESLWPVGVFLPPIDVNDLGYSSRDHMTPDFSNGLDHPDPLLVTGNEAALAVKYIYGRGELFYDDYPHVRALLRNQEERLVNGLDGNILSSLRPESPFYRKSRNMQRGRRQ